MIYKVLLSLFAVGAVAQNLRDENVESDAVESEGSISETVDKNSDLFIYPEVFGDYNLTSCSDAPSCGTTMASFNGIAAKSNGGNQCTGSSCGGYGTYGYHYQCVELAQRYFGEKYGTKAIWYGNAVDLCHTYPSGVVKTSNPIPGDLIVRNTGTYGHVAVITAVHSSTVDVIEQNSSPNGRNSYSRTSSVECFLHASKNSGGGSCPHVGYYCGNDGLGLSANNLYYCSGAGADPKLSQDCSFTCVTMPSGQDDKCSTSGTCSPVDTGYYCGTDKVKGNANTLYLCKDSKPSGAKYCANGCHTASAGHDDYCK